jgi:hypothetical protein
VWGVAERVFASLFLVSASFATPQLAVQSVSQTLVEDSAIGMARGVDRMIGGIVSYAKWPDGTPRATRTMCVVGTPQLSSSLAPTVAGGPVIAVRRSTPAASMGGNCDILFLGRMAVADRQRLIAWVRAKPVLTITDADPDCGHGAMFCLGGRASTLGFSVNLDAIARGTVRIDPRVLKIGSDGGAR